MEKQIRKMAAVVLLGLAAVYGGVWLFNHINAWLGIVAVIIVIYVTIKLMVSIFKNKKDNEK
ncbi:MAG: hypothetical protein IJV24_07160 [Prevotella sp.]|nr:hypothetical protein [Prevotella sp.]